MLEYRIRHKPTLVRRTERVKQGIGSTLLRATGEVCGLAGSDVEGVVAAMDTHAHTLIQGDGAVDVLRVHAEPNLPHASARQLGEGATKQ